MTAEAKIWHDHYTANGNWMFNCGRTSCGPYFENGHPGRPRVIETGPAADERDRLQVARENVGRQP